MRVRSLKQVLHWVFLAVGSLSLIILALSVSAYMDYARDGYGLDAYVDDAWLSGERLMLRLRVENPGGLDIYLGGFDGYHGNLTLDGAYPLHMGDLAVRVRAGNVTFITVSANISEAEYLRISSEGKADLTLNLVLTVPERDTRTNLRLEAADVVVRP